MVMGDYRGATERLALVGTQAASMVMGNYQGATERLALVGTQAASMVMGNYRGANERLALVGTQAAYVVMGNYRGATERLALVGTQAASSHARPLTTHPPQLSAPPSPGAAQRWLSLAAVTPVPHHACRPFPAAAPTHPPAAAGKGRHAGNLRGPLPRRA